MVNHGGLTEAPGAPELAHVAVTPEDHQAHSSPFSTVVMLVMMAALEWHQ